MSTAYYALFHGLAEFCADELFNRNMRGQPGWIRIYRAVPPWDAGARRAEPTPKGKGESNRYSGKAWPVPSDPAREAQTRIF